MPAHNNVLPNQHFHKRWMDRVKTWFNQPARKHRRREARKAKAAKMAPRPVGLLRPIVRPPTQRYNMKQRIGRGFTLEELKQAGVSKRVARSVGIAVDHRRKNHSLEALQLNVDRLKEYKGKLVIFPGKGQLVGLKTAEAAELDSVEQLQGPVLPIKKEEPKQEFRAVDSGKESVYHQLRVIRSDTRLEGLRAKRKREKEEASK